MAIQNFISGGYYGKLGQTIGQRWKNIRTVRAYTKPANPRTEKQQANRKAFGSCVPQAQLAMQMNYNASYFKSESNSEWGLRMSLATTLLKNGNTLLNLIPIIPTSYTPSYEITKINAPLTTDNKTFNFVVSGTLPAVNRSISVLVSRYIETTDSYKNDLFNVTLNYATESNFSITYQEETEINENTKFLIVSNNDTEETASSTDVNTTIASKMLNYEKPKITEIIGTISGILTTSKAGMYIDGNYVFSGLSSLGITTLAQLQAIYPNTGSTTADITIELFDESTEENRTVTTLADVEIVALTAENTIKISILTNEEVGENEYINSIQSLGDKVLGITPNNSDYPTLYIPTMSYQEVFEE